MGAHSDTSVIQQTDDLGGGVSGQRLPSGARIEGVGETAELTSSRGIVAVAAASLGWEATTNPGESDSPHGHEKIGNVDCFFFWQQLPLPTDELAAGRLQHPHAELPRRWPQQHVPP
jgi:hypothetical protein